MDDTERETTARRWLADESAWSRCLASTADPNRWTRVVVALSALDRYDREHPVAYATCAARAPTACASSRLSDDRRGLA